MVSRNPTSIPFALNRRAAVDDPRYMENFTDRCAVKVHIKSRVVTVEGPRGMRITHDSVGVVNRLKGPPISGKLTKNLAHLSVCFSHPSKNLVNIELHHGARKNVATLRTVKTIINNLIIGVTKGFKYKMRYVYAHFPINVNIEKSSETGLYEVDIRYVGNH